MKKLLVMSTVALGLLTTSVTAGNLSSPWQRAPVMEPVCPTYSMLFGAIQWASCGNRVSEYVDHDDDDRPEVEDKPDRDDRPDRDRKDKGNASANNGKGGNYGKTGHSDNGKGRGKGRR